MHINHFMDRSHRENIEIIVERTDKVFSHTSVFGHFVLIYNSGALKFMADRRARSGGKPSVRVVSSIPETSARSTPVSVQRNVTLRPKPGGRLGQSVSHTASDEPIDQHDIDLPDLLDIPDNDDDDGTDGLAQAMEEEFFPTEKKKDPVCIYYCHRL